MRYRDFEARARRRERAVVHAILAASVGFATLLAYLVTR